MTSFDIKGVVAGEKSKRLRTQASTLDMFAQRSWDEGHAFQVLSSEFLIPAHVDVAPQFAATVLEGYSVQMINNAHPDLSLCVRDAIWNSNGGTVVATGASIQKTFTCKGTPVNNLARATANVSPDPMNVPFVVNGASGHPGTDFVFMEAWDNVGAGLVYPAGTVNSALAVTRWQCGQGQTRIPLDGAFVIPPGQGGIGLLHVFDAPDLTVGEVIQCSLTFTCFMVDARNGQTSKYL